MDWKDVAKKVAGLGLPLLANALLPGSGAAVSAVAGAFGLTEVTPDAISQAIDRDPDAAVKLAQIQADKTVELARIVAQQETEARHDETKDAGQVNETMRAELAAASGYRAGWRPLFGYMMALSVGLLFIGIVHAIWVFPANAVDLLKAATDLVMTALVVLGVNIHKRSQDKQTALGDRPTGLLEALAQRIAK